MFFKNFKNKLFILMLLSFFFSIPISANAYSDKIIVGGENIGIEVKSKGVLVVGFYNIDNSSPGKDAGIQIGDIITRVDDTAIYSITDLSDVIKSDSETIKISYIRNNKNYETNLELVKDDDNVYKTGLYVKDKIIGIGTLTFIDPETKKFGALGHEIAEKTTGKKFEIATGKIFESSVTSIEKSSRNTPGEKNANYYTNQVLGDIEKNEINGIYGTYEEDLTNKKLLEVANPDEIVIGKASIRTVINGKKIEEFLVEITNINTNDKTKNILFEVTDEKLLKTTNGIVQGMSGSPIIQNSKIIGAVTHVVVDNPHKGYGIFITNMLEEAEKE